MVNADLANLATAIHHMASQVTDAKESINARVDSIKDKMSTSFRD